MKRGPEKILEQYRPGKRFRREKSLNEILEQVFLGKFDEFKEYVNQHALHTLDLSASFRSGPGHAKALGKALCGTNVTSLNLRKNRITGYEAVELIQALRGTKVTLLDLSANHIAVGHIEALGKALCGTNVSSLDLGRNEINLINAYDLAKALRSAKVTFLNLSLGYLEPFYAKIFIEALCETQVSSLELSFYSIGPDGAFALAEGLHGTNVVSLALSANKIEAAGAKALAQALQGTNVVSLALSTNSIDDAGAKALVKGLRGTKVTSLKLESNQLTYEGANLLALEVPGTSLLQITLGDHLAGFTHNEHHMSQQDLKEALSLNQEKTVLAPYYAAGLYFMSKSEKAKHYPCDSGQIRLPNPDNELEYAGGILMNLPRNLVENILSFLPGMDSELKNGKNRVRNYTALFKKNHKDGLRVNEHQPEIFVDASEIGDDENTRNGCCKIC